MRAKTLSEDHKKHISESIKKAGNKPPVRFGDKNNKWKGEDVGYRALHDWIVRQRGKPQFCEACKRSEAPEKRSRGHVPLKKRDYFEWANVSGKYKRDVQDWKRLCVKCHKAYDKRTK